MFYNKITCTFLSHTYFDFEIYGEYIGENTATRKELHVIKTLFAMYNPETDRIKINLNEQIHASFDCQKYNNSVHLNEPSDIAYLIRLAREEPEQYVKLAAKDGELQEYIEARDEFN